jgi:FixJ family two-component response regulator
LEHITVINQILAADHRAKAITGEAAAERDRLRADIDAERQKLQEEYMERARRRVEAEAARERAVSDRVIAELDEKLRHDLDMVDRRLGVHREALAERMFSMIVGMGE